MGVDIVPLAVAFQDGVDHRQVAGRERRVQQAQEGAAQDRDAGPDDVCRNNKRNDRVQPLPAGNRHSDDREHDSG